MADRRTSIRPGRIKMLAERLLTSTAYPIGAVGAGLLAAPIDSLLGCLGRAFVAWSIVTLLWLRHLREESR